LVKVLVISPHPDDEAIGCGGTLCRHADAGDDIFAIFLTSGEHGSRVMAPAKTAATREREAAAAAQILGISKFEFWRQPDGSLRCSAPLVNRLAAVLRQFAPRFIYTTHASEAHADHRAAIRLTQRALDQVHIAAPTLRLFEVWTPLQRFDTVEDISAFVERKQRAVRCYASQLANVEFDTAALALNRYRGALHNQGGGEFAEAFLQRCGSERLSKQTPP
jgi:LmbE family N-acetylglucosaminyl deacetylase